MGSEPPPPLFFFFFFFFFPISTLDLLRSLSVSGSRHGFPLTPALNRECSDGANLYLMLAFALVLFDLITVGGKRKGSSFEPLGSVLSLIDLD